MAKRLIRGTMNVVLMDDGAGGYDFVVTNAVPLVDDPGAVLQIDKFIRDPQKWFKFSDVTAGTAFDETDSIGQIKGRKVSGATTVAAIVAAFVSEMKTQGGV